jgi:hypothetical protein
MMFFRILPAFALVLATAASAQTPPGPQDGQQATGPGLHQLPGPPPGFGGPELWGPRHMPPPPPPPSKAAHFRLHNGNVAIDVKCADDEPMKACVDAAAQLVDKLSGIPERQAR